MSVVKNYLLEVYPEGATVREISAGTGLSIVEVQINLNVLENAGEVQSSERAIISDIILFEKLLRDTIENQQILERYESAASSSYSDRYFMIKLREQIESDLKKIESLKTVETIYTVKIKYRHWTVVGNMETGGQEVQTLRASCTIDFDVVITKEDDYYKQAVVKIKDWVDSMFNKHEVKFSSETSTTDVNVAAELLEKDEIVTLIHYDWWWQRTGRTENGESKEGYINWTDEIPLGESDGWFTPGAPRRSAG